MAALLERLRSATADEAMPARFYRGSERLLVVGWPVGGGSASMIGLEPSPDSDCTDQLPCCAWAGNRQWERRPRGANLKVECPFNARGSNGSGVEHHHQRKGGCRHITSTTCPKADVPARFFHHAPFVINSTMQLRKVSDAGHQGPCNALSTLGPLDPCPPHFGWIRWSRDVGFCVLCCSVWRRLREKKAKLTSSLPSPLAGPVMDAAPSPQFADAGSTESGMAGFVLVALVAQGLRIR